MPYLTMLCVWPPHTSMIVHGFVTSPAMACAKWRTAASSRYSSRYFIAVLQFLNFIHLLEIVEYAPRFRFVHNGERKPDVNQHVVADTSLRSERQIHFLGDSTEADLGSARDHVVTADTLYAPRNRQTHDSLHFARSRNQLSQRDAAIVGRHLPVPIRPKAFFSQALNSALRQIIVLKTPAAQRNTLNLHAPCDADDRFNHRVVNARGNLLHRNTARAVRQHTFNHARTIEHQRPIAAAFTQINLVGLIRRNRTHRKFQLDRGLPLEACALSQSQD